MLWLWPWPDNTCSFLSLSLAPSFLLLLLLLLYSAAMALPPAHASVALALLIMGSWSSWLLPVAGRTTISHLPGFDGPLPVELETGYVAVGESDEVNLFYYFIKSERNPAEDPVMVWLTGGPGCSGLSGMAYEIGPLTFDVKINDSGRLPTLVYRPESWTQVCNIIFLDSPVGTGFSYSKTVEGYKTGDTKSSRDVHTFVRKWFTDHPEFISNPLYIGGDSYSGMTLPVVVQEVSNGIRAGVEPLFNLKGYLVGNPVTDHGFDSGSVIPYAHGVGLISDELYETTRKSCGGEYVTPRSAQCAKYIEVVNEGLQGINTAHILEPICFFAVPKPELGAVERRYLDENNRNLAAERRHLDEQARGLYLSQSFPKECRSYGYLLSYFWTNNESVREALGVHKGSIGDWMRCNDFGLNNYTHDATSTVAYHLNLTSGGYRALVYSGDHDMTVPFLGTQAWIRSLNFSIVEDWRSWWVEGNVAGFTRTYSNNLTFTTVKGGGHTAPEYRPKECLAMLERWISERAL